jgi:pSer/pThr/pTyr-binding forkhead associated (FHA) protein
MWKLVIEDDEGKRTVVPLTRDDYTIGRQEGNTIRLTERNVSRSHGRVRRTRSNGSGKDAFVLEDLRSYNGVFVNGLRVAHTQELLHGDLVQIGDYRIVLQDDAVSPTETAAMPILTEQDAKQTQQIATPFRGQTLTDRPNRLVQLVGPTPGVEFPLDRERMSVGRAEDASISVNHNSVSRLHCEIHALGDGRFEIVDKGSSNGVRVNGVELKRSIIEAGDVIELGDVRFKFVGAGQVFVAGPNESQQLTAISDRDAELAVGARKGGLGGYLGSILGAGVVGAALIVGVVYFMRQRAAASATDIAPAVDAEQAIVLDAKKSCTVDDCEVAHMTVTTQLPEASPWRESPEFHEIEQTWAASILKRAEAEQDPAARRGLFQRIVATPTVDAERRKQAGDLLSQLDPGIVSDGGPGAVRDGGTTPIAAVTPVTAPGPAPAPAPAPQPRSAPTSHTTVTNATTSAPPSSPTAASTPKTTSGSSGGGSSSAFERAREAGLNGNYPEVRRLLETKVMGGHASADEARIVRQACKAMGDTACSDAIKAKYP